MRVPTHASRRARATGPARGPVYPCLFLILALVLGAPVAASTDATAGAAETPDVVALEALVDDLMSEQFDALDLVGAVVTVVQVDRPTFSKGYGYADLALRTPVDPARTMFRIGSITKLFVWTAVMQLVEQGALDLNADVNSYLRAVQVPDTYPEPVTLAHLMAHTAGFEDRSVGLFARSSDAVRPLAEILANDLPARVHPVGEVAAYSNHGAALAALVVEEVSGLDWNDYLEAHILTPLGMTRSTGAQPVPAALEGDLAVGYVAVAGSFEPQTFTYVPMAPAGSVSATGDDMARFMLAHLQGGALDGGSILHPETVAAMHRTHATQDPRLSGNAHGFIEQSFAGRRTIGHGGGIVAFQSLLVLVPDDGLGLFISYSTRAGTAAAPAFVADFFDRWYAADDDAVDATASTPPVQRPDVAGTYRPTRVAHTTLDKLAGLLQAATIVASDDGTLVAQNLGAFGTTRWSPVEPLVHREVGGGDLLVFLEDDEGRVVRALLDSQPAVAFDRLAWHQSAAFHLVLIATVVVVFLSAVFGWPLVGRWRRGARSIGRFAGPTAWTASAAFLVFLASLALVLRDPMEIAFGVPPMLRAVLVLGMVGSALTLVGGYFAVRAWVRGDASVAARVHYSVVVAAGLAFVWFMDTWNLLGFRF